MDGTDNRSGFSFAALFDAGRGAYTSVMDLVRRGLGAACMTRRIDTSDESFLPDFQCQKNLVYIEMTGGPTGGPQKADEWYSTSTRCSMATYLCTGVLLTCRGKVLYDTVPSAPSYRDEGEDNLGFK